MVTLRIHCLMHVPFEGPAAIGKWAEQKGYPLTLTRLYQNDTLPDMQSFDRLFVLGGPMNIYEERRYPFLGPEKAFIEKAIQARKTVVGICLGAQLIADVLGKKVYPNPEKEIGWYTLTFTDEALFHPLFSGFPKQMKVLHWHGDTFELPDGCIPVGQSAACRNQGFILNGGKILGLQFHMEMTEESLCLLVENCEDELTQGEFISSKKDILGKEELVQENTLWLYRLSERIP